MLNSFPFRTTRLPLFIAALAALLIGGCARPLLQNPLPSGIELTQLGRIASPELLAWDATGHQLAWWDGGVHGYASADGTAWQLPLPRPDVLALAPDGQRLAVAYRGESRSDWRLLDRQGRALARSAPQALISQLIWSETGLLAAATELRVYSFGANHRALLLRWDGAGEPQSLQLGETVLKPGTLARWGEALLTMPEMQLSYWGDELLFTRLKDPPAFAPYRELVVRHLAGGERLLGQLDLERQGGRYSDFGETLLASDEHAQLLRLGIWTEQQTPLAIRAHHWAGSPGGDWLLTDVALYHRGRAVLHFSAPVRGQFAPVGGRLALVQGRRLYLLTGLTESTPRLTAEQRARLLTLRRWRAAGLIEPAEFQTLQQRIGYEP